MNKNQVCKLTYNVNVNLDLASLHTSYLHAVSVKKKKGVIRVQHVSAIASLSASAENARSHKFEVEKCRNTRNICGSSYSLATCTQNWDLYNSNASAVLSPQTCIMIKFMRSPMTSSESETDSKPIIVLLLLLFNECIYFQLFTFNSKSFPAENYSYRLN